MRIGIITDIHENEAVLCDSLRIAETNKCDEMACLGDIVGYDTRFYDHSRARSASKCIQIIRSECRWIAAGNHDLNAAGRIPSFMNGFGYPENWFSLKGEERKKISSGKVWCYEYDAPNDLNDSELEFLRSLPEYVITMETGMPCLFSHYIFPDFTGSTTQYIERKRQMKKHWTFMSSNNLHLSFVGHSHNHFPGFAYNNFSSFLRAFHSLPHDNFNIGQEPVVIMLPPLSGEKGRTGFTIIDTDTMKLSIIALTTK